MRVRVDGRTLAYKDGVSLADVTGSMPGYDELQVIKNGQFVNEPQHKERIREDDALIYAAKDIVKAMPMALPYQKMALDDISDLADYLEKAYDFELEVEPFWQDDHIIIINFPAPPSYPVKYFPLLVPLWGYPEQPPAGLHVPLGTKAYPRLKAQYSVFEDQAPPYPRTEQLIKSGWAWLCLRKRTATGDGWSWDYQHTTGGVDSLFKLLAVFDAHNRSNK